MESATETATGTKPLTHERSDPEHFLRIAPDVRLGKDVAIHCFVNLYGCRIGDESRIGAFVEIQKNAFIGARCKISSHTFICEGVTIEDEVFVGHGVMFINDIDPRAAGPGGRPLTEADWKVIPTRICRGAAIGSGAVIMAGITIGAGALVGAGAVVTADVEPNAVVCGCPARFLRQRDPAGADGAEGALDDIEGRAEPQAGETGEGLDFDDEIDPGEADDFSKGDESSEDLDS